MRRVERKLGQQREMPPAESISVTDRLKTNSEGFSVARKGEMNTLITLQSQMRGRLKKRQLGWNRVYHVPCTG